MKLHELKAQLAELKAAGAALAEEVEEAGRDFTDPERVEAQRIEGEMNRLAKAIAESEAEDARVRADAALKQRLRKAPDAGPRAAPISLPVDPRTGRIDPRAHDVPLSLMLRQDPAMCGGFNDLAEFAMAVRAASDPRGGAVADPRLYAAPTGFHRETSSADGFMVPAAFRAEVWELVFNQTDVLGLVGAEPTSSNIVQLAADESTPWSTTGVQAYWAGEGVQLTSSRLETEGRQVRLHKLHAYVLATEELLSDAPRLNDRLTRQAAAALRYKASDAIVNGAGAGQPLGFLNSGALISVAKESGQVADTIVTANVLKVFARFLGAQTAMSGNGPFWLAHMSTVPHLGVLTIGDQPAWTSPATGLRGPVAGQMLGFPIVFSQHAAVVGDVGDLTLVDPGGYYAVTRASGIQFAESMHLFFDYDITAFRWTMRMGGTPFLEAAVSPANGSDTLSHFVTIAARA